jgi:O-antigen/teichoic acid export membrane protein
VGVGRIKVVDMTVRNDTLPGAAGQAAHRRLVGRLLRGTAWSMVGIAALGLTRLIYTALVGRTGDPARLAEVNAQVSLAFFATFATAAATGAGASKFLPLLTASSGPAAAAAVRRRLRHWTILSTGTVTAGIAALGPWLLPGTGYDGVVEVCALTVAYGAYSYTKSVLYGFHLAHRYAVLEVCADTAILVLTVAAVWWAPDLVLAPLVIGYAAFAIGATLSTPRHVPGPIPPVGAELGGFVAFTALGIAAGQGFFQISMVVARHTADGGDAGAYAAAMALVSPAFFLPRALALAFFPAAAEAVGRGDDRALAQHTRQLTRLLWLAAAPALTVAAIVGTPALRLVFGPSYEGGGPVLAILLGAVLLYVLAVPSVNVLSAQPLRFARIPPLASTVGVLVGAVTWLVLAERLGAVGVACGYLAGMLVQAGTPLTITFRRIGPPRPATAARVVLSLLVSVGLGWLAVADPQPIVVGVGVVGYLAIFCVLFRRDLVATARIVRHKGGFPKPSAPLTT